jgi:O-antigen ligase
LNLNVHLISPRWAAGAFVALVAIVAVCSTQVGPYVPIVLLAIAYIMWSFPRPVVAVSTIILLNAYIRELSTGITPEEYAIGFYLYGYLGYWFVSKIFFQRERFVTHRLQWYLIGFLLLCASSVVMIFATETSPEFWFRDGLTISTLLLAFPAREAMQTERGLKIVLGAYVLLVCSLAIVNIAEYRTATIAANYLWELWGGRRPFGSAFYGSLAVGAISMYVHAREFRQQALSLVLAMVGILALATTFFRGFWIGTLIGCMTLLFLVGRQRALRLVGFGLIACVLGFGVIFFVAGAKGSYIIEAFSSRLVSSGKGFQDLSIANRIAESETVLNLVKSSPLVGYGYGAWFHHFNIISRTTEILQYIHNTYVFLLFKVGVFGLLLFGAYCLSILKEGFRLSRTEEVSTLRLAMIRAGLGILVGYLFVGTNMGMLQDKQALMVIMLTTAFVTPVREP